jgi:quinol monooxygenase YgiN
MSHYLVTMKAQVPPDMEERLLLAYDFVMRNRPPGIVQSMLTKDTHDSTTWRIYTIWESQEALEAYYESTVESGVLMPSARVFQLVEIVPVGDGGEVVAADTADTMAPAPPQQDLHDQHDTLS